MADAGQGNGSSPLVPALWRKKLRKYDREFSKHQRIASMYWYLNWSTKSRYKAIEIDSKRRELRMKMKDLKRLA